MAAPRMRMLPSSGSVMTRMGCLLMLAALCLAGIAHARISDVRVMSNTKGLGYHAVDNTLPSRQLLQDGSFKGGPGEDGGTGGLPPSTQTAQPGKISQMFSIAGNGGSGGSGGNGAASQPSCAFGEYILNGKCTKCVSKLPTASTETLRGRKCAKPFGGNSINSCNFGFLSGLQIGKTENPFTVSNCIDYKRDLVTLYVPRAGFNFFGATAKKYFYDSMSIAGAPLLPAAGIPLSYSYTRVINGIKFDALVFKGTSAILSKAKGKIVAVNGVVRVAGDFDLCFAATAEVCK